MAIDFGEILTRAWKITWKHKILWAYGLIGMLVGFLFLPLGFAPAIGVFASGDVPVWFEEPVYIFGYVGLFFILFIASFLVSALMQAAISYGVLQAEKRNFTFTFNSVLQGSIPLWGRFLGATLLYTGGVLLVTLGYYALQFLVSVLTLGLGTLCLAPFQLLLYPMVLVAYAWYEQALAAIAVNDCSVLDAARRGWHVFRKNLLAVILMSLILYMGIGMISAFASIPLLAPLFVTFFSVMEGMEGSRTVLVISALCATVYLPFLAVFQSIALTFMKSGWLLTYLQITRTTETDALVSSTV